MIWFFIYGYPTRGKEYNIPNIAEWAEVTWKPSVKTVHLPLRYFRSPLSAKSLRHYVRNDGAQHCLA